MQNYQIVFHPAPYQNSTTTVALILLACLFIALGVYLFTSKMGVTVISHWLPFGGTSPYITTSKRGKHPNGTFLSYKKARIYGLFMFFVALFILLSLFFEQVPV